MKQELTTATLRHVPFIKQGPCAVACICFHLLNRPYPSSHFHFTDNACYFVVQVTEMHAMLGEMYHKGPIGVSFVLKPARNTHVFDDVRAEAVGCGSSIYGLRAV